MLLSTADDMTLTDGFRSQIDRDQDGFNFVVLDV